MVMGFSLFFSSCAIHGGSYASSANVSSSNFKIMENVSGHSKTFKVLGIGGVSKDALIAAAKEDLLSKYTLEANQILGNVSVDTKTVTFILVGRHIVTFTADVIEFEK